MSDPLFTGAFGVIVAMVTWLLAGHRERQNFRRDLQRERVAKLENLYAGCIEALEMSIRITHSMESYKEIGREHSKQNALLRLLSTKEINIQNEKVSDLLHQWSSLYRRGEPKPVGETGMAIIQSGDSKYSQQAKEMWPQVNDELVVLITLMTKHLANE